MLFTEWNELKILGLEMYLIFILTSILIYVNKLYNEKRKMFENTIKLARKGDLTIDEQIDYKQLMDSAF